MGNINIEKVNRENIFSEKKNKRKSGVFFLKKEEISLIPRIMITEKAECFNSINFSIS